jgi:hypothetical protein
LLAAFCLTSDTHSEKMPFVTHGPNRYRPSRVNLRGRPRPHLHSRRRMAALIGTGVSVVAFGALAARLTENPRGEPTVSPRAHATTAAAVGHQRRNSLRTADIVFVVTGTGHPVITYGNDSASYSADKGQGVALPWSAKLPYDKNPLHWSVTARLQGSGDITCQLRVRVTLWGTSRPRGDKTGPISVMRVIKTGHASGPHAVCTAESR